MSEPISPPKKPHPAAGLKWKQLTPAEWEQVVVLWELGKATAADLAKMFGISEMGLRKGLKKRGSVKGCRSAEIGFSAVEAAKTDVQKNFERVATMKEKFIGYGDLLAKLTMRELTEAVRDKVPLATKRNDIQTLQRAAAVLASVRSESYHLLGLNDETLQTEELPDIGIAEYSSAEIDKIQRGFEEVDAIIEAEDDAFADLHLPFEDEDDFL